MLERIVRQPWFYWFGRFLFKAFAFVFLGLRIQGVEHVPRQGALVVAANHFSSLDPPILGVSVPREIHFMAKKELFEPGSVSRLMMIGFRCFPVDRQGKDFGSLRHALRELATGMAIGIFVQGTRSRDGAAAQGGAAFLALRTRSPLLPAGIFRRGWRYTVRFGEPIATDSDGLTAQQLTAELTRRINELLPEEQHISAYADDDPAPGDTGSASL